MLQQQKHGSPSLPVSLAQIREISMEVVFGTPSQNCIGSGICMLMNRLPHHQQLQCPHAPAWISFVQGSLVFRFSKVEVTRKDAVSRFNDSWFLVEESFKLPRYSARHLGLPVEWVRPGMYAMEETPKDWILTFIIQE